MKKDHNIPIEIVDLDASPVEDENSGINLRPYYTEEIDNSVKKKIQKKKVKQISFIILFCVVTFYLAFLLLGLCTTDYYIDENNQKQLVVADYTILKNRKDYNEITKMMGNIRSIMVDVTVLDIKVANGDIEYIEAANEYTSILNDQIDTLIPKVQAMDLDSSNQYIEQSIESLLSNDIAIYLQNISSALTSADSQTLSDAMAWRESMWQSYDDIDEQIQMLADKIHKTDDSYFAWNLEEAVTDKDSSAVLKNN